MLAKSQVKQTTIRKKRRRAKRRICREIPIYRVLTPKVLMKLYHEERKSLEDIARLFKCTRMYVMKLSRKYNIPLRSKGEARYLALKMDKLPQQYREVNHDFFSRWSSEMAYILGYFCADGNMHRDKKNKSWHFRIASNDRAHLQTIKKTMASTHGFLTRKTQPKLLTMQFVSERICKDLLALGITPRKSLTLQFPKVPLEYLNDFIRGYFDGDGSIYVEKRNQAVRFAIFSGSKNFLVVLKKHLKIILPSVRGKLYKRKGARCYDLRYFRIDDIPKLFEFLYPKAQNTLCLKRKYEKFQDALTIVRNRISIRNARRKRAQ